MKIAVVGLGYVGLSISVLLAQHNEVVANDLMAEKVDMVNKKISPIVDADIEYYLQNKSLNLRATMDKEETYKGADYVIIATPTDYDVDKDFFNTKSVEAVIKEALEFAPDSTIVIKSTIPVGYTERIRKEFSTDNIIFSPEFLREGRALYDNLHPSRIVVGGKTPEAVRFAELLQEGAIDEDIPVLFTESSEAESIKLFSNTYLALRVAYFNELDTYAEVKDLDAEAVIKGVSLDPRIGDFYNNPSFGYGGYCLPKDTKQLRANYKDIPEVLISAIVLSNRTRKDYISQQILSHKPEVVGIYKLAMKSGSDNYRHSSVLGIMKRLRAEGVRVVLYEPMLQEKDNIYKYEIIDDLEEFKNMSDIIVTNRYSADLADVKEKVYTRDLFKRD